MNYQKITIYTLVLSLFTLAWMVPGGPVETRSFSNILPEIVMGFNIFLTSLMIVSIALVYFMYKKQKWAYQLTGVVGLAFALVFLLDLGGIFPVSLDPMQTLLFVMEVIGLILLKRGQIHGSSATHSMAPPFRAGWRLSYRAPCSAIWFGFFGLVCLA